MKKVKNILFVILITPTLFLMFSFSAGGGSVASNKRFEKGNPASANTKTEFNAGEEIYVCIPLAKHIEKDPRIKLEIDGKEAFMQDNLAYESEQKLDYYAFALAIDPKNHNPEQYFYKEGKYRAILRELSKMTPGKHKITFSVAIASYGNFDNKIALTITADQAGLDKWKGWEAELDKMDITYKEKLAKE